MAFDEKLAHRIRQAFGTRRDVTERKMFGGLTFLCHGRMCCGVVGADLMVRVAEDDYDELLSGRNVRPMDFTGRPLAGFVYVSPSGFRTEAALREWLSRGERVAIQKAAEEPAKRRSYPRHGIRVNDQWRSVLSGRMDALHLAQFFGKAIKKLPPLKTRSSSIADVNQDLLRAISEKHLIEFVYKTGRSRIAEPHDYGISNGVESLLAYQISGESSSRSPHGWKQLAVADIHQLRVLDRRFRGTRADASQNHREWDVLFARVK
jgi:TfoX/Sxy family transcriptional regulator of competence genes